jgi:enoyl-CoA hydratase/carnithine racemase
MIMANQSINAEQALNIGLVHALFEDDEFESRVMAFCETLAAYPPEMMAMAKLTIDLVADATPGRARIIERLGQSILQVGDESANLLASMQAKLGAQK